MSKVWVSNTSLGTQGEVENNCLHKTRHKNSVVCIKQPIIVLKIEPHPRRSDKKCSFFLSLSFILNLKSIFSSFFFPKGHFLFLYFNLISKSTLFLLTTLLCKFGSRTKLKQEKKIKTNKTNLSWLRQETCCKRVKIERRNLSRNI